MFYSIHLCRRFVRTVVSIQVIALIAHLRSKNVNGPFLVTAPLATLPNWVNEFKKWLPSVDVLLYHGSKQHRQELRKTAMKPRMSRTPLFPVVVTSYEVGSCVFPCLLHTCVGGLLMLPRHVAVVPVEVSPPPGKVKNFFGKLLFRITPTLLSPCVPAYCPWIKKRPPLRFRFTFCVLSFARLAATGAFFCYDVLMFCSG